MVKVKEEPNWIAFWVLTVIIIGLVIGLIIQLNINSDIKSSLESCGFDYLHTSSIYNCNFVENWKSCYLVNVTTIENHLEVVDEWVVYNKTVCSKLKRVSGGLNG